MADIFVLRLPATPVKKVGATHVRGKSFAGGTAARWGNAKKPTDRKENSMSNETGLPILVVSYRADQYDAVRAFALDAFFFEQTFRQWKAIKDKTVRLLIRDGVDICEVDFDHTAFVRWAIARNVQSTQQTRIAFCAELVSRNKH